MNRIELIVHSSLLLIALGLAYGAWKADAPEERRSFAIFEPAQGIQEVSWEDEKTLATVQVDGKGDDVRTWITHGRRQLIPKAPPEAPTSPPASAPTTSASADAGTPPDGGPAAPDAGSQRPDAGSANPDAGSQKPDAGDKAAAPASNPASAPVAEEPKEPTPPKYGKPQLRSFPGNETAGQLVEALSPLKAVRQFDDVDEETSKAMGMDAPKGTLTVKARDGKSIVFEVGETAYGTRSTYVRKKGEKTVYLLGGDIVSMVRSADSRLMERRFWTFDEPTAVAIEVGTPGTPAVRLEQQARLSKGSSYWTRAGSEVRVTEIEGFVDKLFDLRVQTYPSASDAPDAKDLETVLAATFSVEGGKGVKLELARSAGEPGKEKWYARTQLTRSWVAVRASVATDMAELLPKLAPAPE